MAKYSLVTGQTIFQDTAILIGPSLGTAAGVYTSRPIIIPKFATVIDVIVHQIALWDAGTSATGKVGDATDDDGYYTGIDMKATDLLAGESLSFSKTGGKEGAYCVGTATHWTTRYLTAQRSIKLIVTTVGTAITTGSTRLTVLYAWNDSTRIPSNGTYVAS